MSVIATQDDVTPNIIVHIMINEDGAREISLRSVLCFKNNISRPIYLLIKYSDNSIEHYLNSDAEWSIPIKFAHPKAKLFCRLSKDDNWINALQSLSVCVQQVLIYYYYCYLYYYFHFFLRVLLGLNLRLKFALFQITGHYY